jgi:hypothetical protein
MFVELTIVNSGVKPNLAEQVQVIKENNDFVCGVEFMQGSRNLYREMGMLEYVCGA